MKTVHHYQLQCLSTIGRKAAVAAAAAAMELTQNLKSSNLRPTTRECVHMVSGTDMTPGISNCHVYWPSLDDAMRLPSERCIHALTSVAVAG